MNLVKEKVIGVLEEMFFFFWFLNGNIWVLRIIKREWFFGGVVLKDVRVFNGEIE